MTTITESITVDVPVREADKEWTRFESRGFLKGYVNRDIAPSRLDAGACEVTFAAIGDSQALVSVTVTCEVPDEVEHAREDLKRDLQEYQTMLMRQCDKDDCRPA